MNDRFSPFDAVRVPDQWDDIVTRAEAIDPTPRRERRALRPLVLMGAAAAVVALVAAWWR